MTQSLQGVPSADCLDSAAESPRRVSCPHAETCSGCPLIGLDYSEQLRLKHDAVHSALARYESLSALPVGDTWGAAELTRYRTRAKLVVGQDGSLGLYRAGTHQVVDIPECQVLVPALARVAAALRQALGSVPEDTLSAVDLRAAEVRGETQVLVTLVGHAQTKSAWRDLAERLLAEPDVAGVAVSARTRGAATVLGGAPEPLAGSSACFDEIGGVLHLATPGAFTQAHRTQAAALHAGIVEWLGTVLGALKGQRVFDVYGGSGAIGLALANAGAQVTLFESFPGAVASARRAAEHSRLPLDAVLGDAAASLVDCAAASPPRGIIVNPPRRGLSVPLRRSLGALRPEALVYVSCHPDTLARDLAHLVELGFRVASVQPLDMIPLSHSVETVVGLVPGPQPKVRVLFENEEVLLVDKPPHLPTTSQRSDEDSLRLRVQARDGLGQAAAVRPLDAGASGVVAFVRTAASATNSRPTAGSADPRYLALVRGIASNKGSVNRPLVDGGKPRPARTRYRRLEVVSGHSLLEVFPQGELRHQVRRHLASLGHPVIGDERYGHDASNRFFAERHGLDRPFLHAESLVLGDGERIACPLAPDLEAVLTSLRGKSDDPGTSE